MSGNCRCDGDTDEEESVCAALGLDHEYLLCRYRARDDHARHQKHLALGNHHDEPAVRIRLASRRPRLLAPFQRQERAPTMVAAAHGTSPGGSRGLLVRSIDGTDIPPSYSVEKIQALELVSLCISLMSISVALVTFYWFMRMRRSFRHE